MLFWNDIREKLLQPGIARRFTLWVLLFSSFITLLATSAQLFFDYQRDLLRVEERFDEIRSTHLESLQQNLWLTNHQAVLLQLQGIVRLVDIRYLAVELTEGGLLTAGKEGAPEWVLERHYPLQHFYREQWHALGSLRVQADLQAIYQRLWDKLLVILVTQAVKTFLVSFFILGLFHVMVGRHLRALAEFADRMDVDREFTSLALRRRPSPVGREDELDRLILAINRAGHYLRRVFLQQRESNLRLRRQIMEREQAEQELRRRSDQYLGMIQATPDGFWMVGGDGRILDVNATYCDLTGYTRESLLASRDPRHQGLLKGVMEVQSGMQVWMHPTLHEGEIPMQASITSIPDQGVWVCFFRDIRPHHRMLEALRHERDRVQQYLDIVDVILLALDLEGNVTAINRKGCVLLERGEEAILGQAWFESYVPEQERQGLREQFAEFLSNDAGGIRYGEYEIITGGGERRLIQWRTTRIRDEDGRVVGTLNSGEDVTGQRQIEAEILQQSERFRAMVETSSDGYWLVDHQGRILDANQAYGRISGYERSELLTMHVSDLEAEENPQEIAEHIAHVMKTGRDRFEAHHFRKDGSKVLLEVSVTHIPGQNLMISFFRDLTQLRIMEERLRQGEKMQAMGQLAGGVAHDLNNQLGGIMGFAELIRLSPCDEEIRRHAGEILTSSRRAADLTRNLLAFARQGKMLRAPVNLIALMGEVVALLRRSIDKRITLHWPEGAPAAMTMGDPSQLQNALLNLALNARDAMPDGGELALTCSQVMVGEEERVLFPELALGAYWRVQVVDTGVGMGLEVQRRLFEPFFTTKEVGRGTGLGLASVYGTVQSHQGTIHVMSEKGRGSCFTLYLPVTSQQEIIVETASDQPLPVLEILLVDDEPSVRAMMFAMLRAGGHRVTACKDGVEALEVFQQRFREFDLVILDQVMPRMNGREVYTRMREIHPGVQVLLASGYSLNEEIQSLLDEGCRGFLQKPFLIHELNKKLREVLA